MRELFEDKSIFLGIGFVLFIASLLVVYIAYMADMAAERNLMSEEGEQTVDDILNEKVDKEESFYVVKQGKYTIQLSPGEYRVWLTWDRERRRQFIRDFMKMKPGQFKRKDVDNSVQ